ncbi:MAG: hypothetical protein ABIZ04_10375 [Opitutus sp.]
MTKSPVRYFFHKLGYGNSEVRKYLGHAQPGEAGNIAIFFCESSVAECRAGKKGRDASEFCVAGDPENHAQIRVVIVAHREFWVLQPSGPVVEGESFIGRDGQPDRIKLMPITVLARKPITAIPHLLASMASNAYWSRGTFREIGRAAPDTGGGETWDGWQHQLAIELQLPDSIRQLSCPALRQGALLLFLSSVELETVVAKVFEEAGCFVPAYRGGNMADVDILAHNDSAKEIIIGDRALAPGTSLAIQVKSWMRQPPRVVDGILSVSLNLHRKDKGKGWDASHLWQLIERSPQTLAWLQRSLAWHQSGVTGQCIEPAAKMAQESSFLQ